jgi:alpha-L-rhamnosidase
MTSTANSWIRATLRSRLPIIAGGVVFALVAGAISLWLLQPAVEVITKNVKPTLVRQRDGLALFDLGKAWFGNISLTSDNANIGRKLTIRLGEHLTDTGRIDRTPPGTVRFFETMVTLGSGIFTPALLPKDQRGLPRGHAALPFRYIEIEGWKGDFSADVLTATTYRSKYHNERGKIEFLGNDPRARDLNRLVEFGMHTMASTSFMGIFVDGDRERLPYQADAYINQMGWYAATGDVQVARRTFAQLLREPTWPSEWMIHFIFLAHFDFMMTGDLSYLRSIYERLKDFTLLEFVDRTGLVSTTDKELAKRFVDRTRADYLDDIVDWPQNERDGYEMVPHNTVVNAFVYAGLRKMAELAAALELKFDERNFAVAADRLRDAMESQLVDTERKVFTDGLESRHVSAHALFVPLAFGLVPAERKDATLTELKSRIAAHGGGFPCSVYAAQYLLESLFDSGEDAAAIDLMLNKTKRGWFNMLDVHSATVTHEAWDPEYKPNEDWNHAWGAAFLNIIQRKLVGVQVLNPGWAAWTIKPSDALGIPIKVTLPTRNKDMRIVITPDVREIRIEGDLAPGLDKTMAENGRWKLSTSNEPK